MTRTYQHRQKESGERGKESDVVRMLTQHLLGYLDQPVHTARGLHNAGAGYGGDDDVNHIGRRCAWLESESEHKYGKTNTGNGSQGKTAITRAYPQRSKNDDELQNH